MKPARAWVRLESGRRLNLLEPNVDSWTDSDLAIGLSRTYRWGGHSCWALPLSVAQHSLLVLALRQMLRPLQKLTRGEALRELLHDADEGLLSYDPISPVKPHLGADFHALAGRMQAAVQTRYRLPPWDDESYAIHKQADRLAAASEALHVAGWSFDDLHETLDIDIPPLMIDPLPLPSGMKPWEPWPAKTAAALFLAKLQDLTSCAERDRTIAALSQAFSRLPASARRRSPRDQEGGSLSDTFVFAQAHNGSQAVEGIVVDGVKEEDGSWDLTADFTIFTTDEELLVCHGHNCDVEVQ